MKTKEQVNTEGRTVFYSVLWPSFRKAALDCGYSLALHGSMESDMDLIAVPWVEDAAPVETLVKAISECIGKTVWSGHHIKNPESKPHNRITYTLSICSDWYIDLSVIPTTPTPPTIFREDEGEQGDGWIDKWEDWKQDNNYRRLSKEAGNKWFKIHNAEIYSTTELFNLFIKTSV